MGKNEQLVASARKRAEMLNTQFTLVFFQPTEKIIYTEITLTSTIKRINSCVQICCPQITKYTKPEQIKRP